MTGFYVKEIIAKGEGKTDSSVEFGPNLNIIEGISDSGKSCIAQCIAFIFGGTDDSPFTESSKYNRVEGIISTDSGDLRIERTVGKNQVNVTSAIPEIQSGIYDTQYRPNNANKHPVLNEVYLKLIGIDELPMVPSDKNFKKKRLTWKNLLGLLYIDEDHITQKGSIILPDQATANTLFLSCLLYLITGHDFSEHDAREKDEISKAKRSAVRDFVNAKIKELGDQKVVVDDQLSKISESDVDIEARIQEITDEIATVEHSITDAIKASRDILSQILIEEDKLTSSQVLSERYKYLRTQYDADIKRLTFIVDGEEKTKKLPQNTKCPFCDNTIKPKENESYIRAAQSELNRILTQINGLTEAENDAAEEQKDIIGIIHELKKKRQDVEKLITEELKPKSESLSFVLSEYKGRLWLSQQKELLSISMKDLTDDLVNLDTEDAKVEKLEYRPKDCFPEDFVKTMSDYAQDILAECKYEGLNTARFDLSSFDLNVNGDDKKTHGKGYRAYLNTVLVLMFRQYLKDHAKYYPSFFMIDTPLHGFDEGVDEAAPESMRTALFNYILSNPGKGQLIVIENMDHIPYLEYEKKGARLITFTKGKTPGRYGFLEDVK